ncbi:MAG: hypothetical protein V1904_12915, partial [Bacteroidota bacterium]
MKTPYNFSIQGYGIKGEPTIQSRDLLFSTIAEDSMTVSWTRGNGDYVLLLGHAGSAISSDPVDGSEYTGDNNFGDGNQIGTGNYVLYVGSAASPSVIVKGLTENTTYYYKAYEFNNTGTNTNYNINNGITGNPGSQKTIGTTQWTGTTSTSWYVSGNWDNGLPGQYMNADVVDQTNEPVISANRNIHDLTIYEDAALTINAGYTLTVTDDLRIKASASGMGGIVLQDNSANITVADSTIVECYINNSPAYWHYASIPITSAKLNVFENYYAWGWNEATASWSNLTNGLMDLTVCKGYSVKWGTGASPTVNFIGTLNKGTKSIAVANSNTGNDSYGWNLVGNPYAATIDWDAVSGWSRSNIDPTAYYLNGSTSSYGQYNYVTNTGLNGGTRYIAPTQGFFIHCDVASSTLQMDNRVMVNYEQDFWKEGEKAVDDQKTLILHAFNTADSKYSDEIALIFLNKASDIYERNYDAYKLLSSNINIPQIYTILSDSLKMSMNAFSSLYDTISIPVYYTVGVSGTFRINTTQNTGFEGS